MAIDKIFDSGSVDGIADNLFNSVSNSVLEIKAMQQRKAAENVQLVVQALKKIESDIQDKYDGVTTVIEKRVSTIRDGKDGQNGANGRDGKDGRPGRDGAVGPRGMDGLNGSNGRDGEDGVSVTNAFIDFDGSLVINLSDGQSLNVGEVVAPDLAEKIKVITNGGGTSQGVLDTLTSLQNQINALVGLGAVNYVGTWNASTNSPTIVASTGDKGDYYVVSVAGSTSIDGQTLWGVGDWIIFNGAVWQRVDGGSTGNFTDLTASGTVTLSAGEANGVAFLNGSKVLSSSSFFTYDDSTGISLLRAFNQSGSTSFTGTTNIGSSVGTSTANPFFQFQGRNDWPFPQILRFQADYVSGADSGMGLTISSRIGNGTFQNRYQLLADGTAHIWSLGASGSEQMRLTSTTLSLVNNPTLSGGTANGVAYLNGSKVLTSGSALTFDGTNLAIGASPTFYGGQVATSGSIAITGGSLLKLWNTGGTGVGGISSPGTDTIAFGIGSSFTEQMRLTSTGLGIGTSSPGYKLDVNGAARVNNLLWFTPSSGLMAIGASGTNFNIYNGPGAETRLTLDSSGNLGIGTSSPGARLSIGDTSTTTSNQIRLHGPASGTAGGASINVVNGTDTIFAAGNASNIIGGSYSSDGMIFWGNAALRFYGNSAERMRLDSSGNLGLGVTPSATTIKTLEVATKGTALTSFGVGDTTLFANAVFNGGYVYANDGVASRYQQNGGTHYWHIAPSGTAGNAISFTQAATLTAAGDYLVGKTAVSDTTVGFQTTSGGRVACGMASGDAYILYSTSASAYRFYVTNAGVINATSTTISAISDQRLKENVRDIDTGLDAIMALKPRRFDWKEGKGQDKKNVAGFIAQEFETVFPECVGTSKAGGDGIEYKNINHETLIPTLVKAIQEQQAITTALTARVAALESI